MPASARNSRIVDWALALVPAAILAIAIPPKFLADPGAVSIFAQLGAEPAGRIATGIFESIAVVLLVVPSLRLWGGLLSAGLMSGAILAHLTVLGLAVDGDPSMFLMAWAAFLCGAVVTWRRRREIPLLGELFPGRGGAATGRDGGP